MRAGGLPVSLLANHILAHFFPPGPGPPFWLLENDVLLAALDKREASEGSASRKVSVPLLAGAPPPGPARPGVSHSNGV